MESRDTEKKRTLTIKDGDITLLEMYILMYSRKRETDKDTWLSFARMQREDGKEDEARHAEEQAEFFENLEEALGRIMEAVRYER